MLSDLSLEDAQETQKAMGAQAQVIRTLRQLLMLHPCLFLLPHRLRKSCLLNHSSAYFLDLGMVL